MGTSALALTQTLREAMHERLVLDTMLQGMMGGSPLFDRIATPPPCTHNHDPAPDPATMARLILGFWLGLCPHQRAWLVVHVHEQATALARIVHTLSEVDAQLTDKIEAQGVMRDETFTPSETDRVEAVCASKVIRWLRDLERHVQVRAYKDFELLGQRGHMRIVGVNDDGVGFCVPFTGT